MIAPTTVSATITPGAPTFSFLVPGDKLWSIRSIVAVASTATGGAPARGYVLTVSTSTGPVLVVGASDAGTEPATVTITWANAPGSTVTAGAIGTVVAPFASPVLRPGYTIVGTIDNPAVGDTWVSATVWYDYTPTG